MRTKQYLAAIRPERRQAHAVDDGLRRRDQRPGRDPRARRPRRRRARRQGADDGPPARSSRCRPTSSPRSSRTPTARPCSSLIERKAAGEEVMAPAAAAEPEQGDRPHGRARGVGGGGQGRRGSAIPTVARPTTARTRPTRPSAQGAAKKAPAKKRGQEGAGQEGAAKTARPRASRLAACGRRAPKPTVVEIDGHQLKLTNLDKVLYPETGFTKGEVIDYYARIAPDDADPPRAIGASRSAAIPNGVDDKSFFEKRCPSHRPEWVEVALRAPATSGGAIDYCLLDDRCRRWCGPATWPPSSCTRRWRGPTTSSSPTMVVFDLDPGAPARP